MGLGVARGRISHHISPIDFRRRPYNARTSVWWTVVVWKSAAYFAFDSNRPHFTEGDERHFVDQGAPTARFLQVLNVLKAGFVKISVE